LLISMLADDSQLPGGQRGRSMKNTLKEPR